LIHDLKVPLAVIEAGVSSLLKRPEKYGDLTDKQEKVLQRVLRNAKITQSLVNDVLELGRSREGIVNLGWFPLCDMVEEALVEIFDLTDSSVSERIRGCKDADRLNDALGGAGLILSVEEGLWARKVCLDETKVIQILRNLLSNALKYRKKKVELIIGMQKGFLMMSVKDDGEGIPPAYHSKVLECYYQKEPSGICSVRGHGVGLAGVVALLEDMGGRLSLESEEGKGATFSVMLPLNEAT
jgi:signal transduction histidine kinase